jgi:hypothetical protein
MSYKNQGNNLKGYPVLQAGSNFEISPYGFDAGSRKFIIDESRIPEMLPTRGMADTSIAYISQSGVTTRGGYAQMYVDKVGSITEEKNGLVSYTVSYLGLIKTPKPVHLTQGTNISQSSDLFTINGLEVAIQPVESLPTATRVYVTTTQPDFAGYGSKVVPPELQQTLRQVEGLPFVSAKQVVFRGWVLTNRDVRQIGPLWEVTDTHNIIVIRNQQT